LNIRYIVPATSGEVSRVQTLIPLHSYPHGFAKTEGLIAQAKDIVSNCDSVVLRIGEYISIAYIIVSISMP
jgi:hypothetical protein